MKLSIVISTRSDPIGAAITFRAFREDVKDLDYEILVVENSDVPRDFQVLLSYISKEYEEKGRAKIFHVDPPCIFTSREKAVDAASGDVILFLDSHMLPIYGCCRAFLDFFANHGDEVGFAYGPCGYHHKIESFSYHARCLETFNAIIYHEPDDTPITFRGVPLAFRKQHFNRIGRYGTFSKHALNWGGGDTHLGLKSLVLGYENWLVSKGGAIHIGPFPDDHYFVRSYAVQHNSIEDRWIGFLIAAYIAGGEKLLYERKAHVERRLHKKLINEELVDKARQLAKAEKRWVDERRIFQFEELRDQKVWLHGYDEPEVAWTKRFRSGLKSMPYVKVEESKRQQPKGNTLKIVPGTDWKTLMQKTLKAQNV